MLSGFRHPLNNKPHRMESERHLAFTCLCRWVESGVMCVRWALCLEWSAHLRFRNGETEFTQ